MRIAESMAAVQYVTNPAGKRTDVIVPLPAWESLLATIEAIAERLDDQEDVALLQEWLQERASGSAKMVSLADVEGELRRDGLLSG
jgi:hypothetical protein